MSAEADETAAPALVDTGDRVSRREFVRTAGLAGLGAVAVGVLAVESPHSFEVNHHSRGVRGLAAGLRVALLTDFHLGPNLGPSDLARWVQASNSVRPDLVCLVGDIVDQAYRGDLSELKEMLPDLRAPLGVYAVPGNHDRTRYRRFDVFAEALREARVSLLMNESVAARDDVRIAGLDDYRVGRPDLDATLAGQSGGDGVATLFLTHNPDVIPELSEVAESGVDLLLAGHNHRASTHHAPDLVTRAASTLVVQAGTATSVRLRDEDQSFNLIEVAHDDVTVVVQGWDGSGYASQDAQRYVRADGRWAKAEGVTSGASSETVDVA